LNRFVEITHNLDRSKFIYLWMKYVTGNNFKHHCTNVLRGHYSKKLSKHNSDDRSFNPVVADERPIGSYDALYICGVSAQGYSTKKNYPHNLHLALKPESGALNTYCFENWTFKISNARVLPIPCEADLPAEFRELPAEFTTCRIFRWAVGHFHKT
jgi:hypothetical protein